jgi:hypothetical protein
MPTNQRPTLCAPCGGECCRTRPGVEAPERFLAADHPVAALAAALGSGDWVLLEHLGVPWRDGTPPPEAERRRIILYPRPATLLERETGRVLTSGEPSPCVFLEPGGCRLAFAARPRMCRSLVPSATGDCQAEWDRRAAALAWLPHQGLVSEALARQTPTVPSA